VHDLAVREMDFGQRTADLGAQLDPVDGGELAEEANPGIDLAPQRLADCHRQSGCRQGGGLVLLVGRKAEIDEDEGEHCRHTDHGRLPPPPVRLRRRFVERFSFKL
jgi:hypothetical protein